MIFGFADDGSLMVLADIAQANRDVEPYDAESGAVEFFDNSGNQLTPIFPHRSDKRILGMRINSDPGPYQLITSQKEDRTLANVLQKVTSVEPNPWFTSVEEIRRHLQTKG